MPYEITIKKIDTKTVTKRGDYSVVDTRPWTTKELADESYHREAVAHFLERNPVKEIRDYAPDWQGLETTQTEILKQTVETIDLAAVIKAINGL